jgi:hypothetical protein
MRAVQLLFTVLISLQFLVVVLHDLVDIPGWTHGTRVREVVGAGKLWTATAINAIFPGLAVGFAVYAWNRPWSGFVSRYCLIYCSVTLISAIVMWYLPYWMGAAPEKKQEFLKMYEGTRQLLPARGDNPRPNLLHVCFHVLFVVTLGLAIVLRFGR